MQITVLGASSDLGEALVYAFADGQNAFHLTARRPDEIEPLQKDLAVRGLAKWVKTWPFDAEKPDFELLERLADETDLLIVCFGFLGDQLEAEKNDAEIERILTINFTAAVRAVRPFSEKMKARKTGAIIGISSVAGERGRASNFFYGSAKAGFTAFLSGLRHSLFSSKIHVMTVLPGFMATKMTAHLELPKRLTASPETAARLIFRGFQKRKNTVFVLPIWQAVMLVVRNLPDFLFLRSKL